MKSSTIWQYIIVGSFAFVAILAFILIIVHLVLHGFIGYKAYLPLFIAPLLGWLTNWIAVRMLFRPYEPPKFPGLQQFQGVIPRRRDKIASKVGAMVENKLLTKDDLHQVVSDLDLDGAVKSAVGTIIDRELGNTTIPIPTAIIRPIKEAIIKKILNNMAHLRDEAIPSLVGTIEIQEMVTQRLDSFSNEQLEHTILSVAERELKHLVLLGGIIGLVIGCIQTAINLWL